ncbi:MAG: ABC transporter permease [Candidatus Firestonebacteria bacterium]
MNFNESFYISLRNLSSNKIRSFLTMLGIIIGVMSIVLLISIIAGTQSKIEGEINSMGSNVLMLVPGNSEEMHGPPGAGFTVNKLKLSQIDMLEGKSSYAIKACPVFITMGTIVKYKRKSRNTAIVAGTGAGFPYVRNWNVAEGAYFRDEDVKSSRKICVVGDTLVRDLYGGSNPIGKDIFVNGKKLLIIGVTEKKGKTFGQDSDDILALPITTAQEILGSSAINQIIIKVPDPKNTVKAMNEIKRQMLTQMDKEDFSLNSQSELLKTFGSFAAILNVVMGCVASISLFVGGIGIMNIMLVTVKERTREIGIRKAVGARSRDILLQFITEAVFLALTGGLIGILLAVVFISAANPLQKVFLDSVVIPLKANPTSIVLAFIFSSAVGIFFGTYPAVKAARTDPIIALRYE